MRIIRLKLKADAKEYLGILSKKLRILDRSFVEDVYSLIRLKGNGLPDDARCEALAKHYSKGKPSGFVLSKILIKKRRSLLKELALTAVFSNFVKNNAVDNPFEFCETLLFSFQKLHRKLRQAQCQTCAYLSDCDFGKQYGSRVRNIGSVIDPDYSRKVHQSCPSMPEIEFLNEFSAALKFISGMSSPQNSAALKNAVNHPPKYKKMAHLPKEEAEVTTKQISGMAASEELSQEEEDQLALDMDLSVFDPDEVRAEEFDDFPTPFNKGFSKVSKIYLTRHVGGTPVILDDSVIEKLKGTTLAIYELSRTLSNLLAKEKKGVFKPVNKQTKDQKQDKIKSVTDAARVLPSQHALPNDAFDMKLAKKELVKSQQQEPEGKKQLLYVLVDTSESMNSVIGLAAEFGYLSRAALSASFTIALCRHVNEEKGLLFLRCFEGGPDKLWACRQKDQFERLQTYIAECDFGGYSTDIFKAVRTAIEDIRSASDELARAEILLVTDCCDKINDDNKAILRQELGNIPLNVLDVSGDSGEGTAEASLKDLSDNYFKVDTTRSTLREMVQLIGGKKKQLTGGRSYAK